MTNTAKPIVTAEDILDPLFRAGKDAAITVVGEYSGNIREDELKAEKVFLDMKKQALADLRRSIQHIKIPKHINIGRIDDIHNEAVDKVLRVLGLEGND